MNLYHSKCGRPANFRLKMFCTIGQNFGISPEGITKLNMTVSTEKPEPIVWDCPRCGEENLSFDDLMIDCSVCFQQIPVAEAVSTLYFPIICPQCERDSKRVTNGDEEGLSPDRVVMLKIMSMPDRPKRVELNSILSKIFIPK